MGGAAGGGGGSALLFGFRRLRSSECISQAIDEGKRGIEEKEGKGAWGKVWLYLALSLMVGDKEERVGVHKSRSYCFITLLCVEIGTEKGNGGS